MTRYPSNLLHVAAIIILGGLFLMTGCSGDDPAAPVPVANEGDPVVDPATDQALWESVLQMPDSWWGFDRSDYNLGVTKLPFPGTPEQLMENFVTVYETRDVGEYLRVLHPDFLTILQEETTQDFPDVGTTLDMSEEQNIHKRMFSGQAVTSPDGDLVPGILNIVFDVFQPLGPWEATPNDDIFPDSQWAPYQVQIRFDRGQTYSSLTVEGVIKFYVVSREFEYGNVTRQFHQMVGQVDLTGGLKGVESVNWGSVKALFR